MALERAAVRLGRREPSESREEREESLSPWWTAFLTRFFLPLAPSAREY